MIIVEDGTIVTDANSYIDLQYVRDYALARNIPTLPVEDAELSGFLFRAMDYIEAMRDCFSGSKTKPEEQSLQFPRKDIFIDNIPLNENTIPVELKKAQAQLIVELSNGVDISPNIIGLPVKVEKIGVIEIEYYTEGGTLPSSKLSIVEKYLSPLMATKYNLISIRV